MIFMMHPTAILSAVRRLLIAGLLMLGVAACSGPPQKEIDQAQTALDLARTSGADKYATSEYTEAASSLKKAHDSVDQRDYRQALNYAIDSRQRSQEAIRLAAEGKTRAQQGADALLTDIAGRAAEFQRRLKAAEDARVPAKDLRAAREAMAEVQTALQEARTAIGAGNYDQVTKSLTEVREKLASGLQELEKIPPRAARKKR
jgi:uncharacterized protein DUF4398